MRKALILVQLGTPDELSVSACRRYLAEFLMDRRVITLPKILRALLVYGIIVPFRSPKTYEAYKSIWKKEGSPLRFFSEKLTEKIQGILPEQIPIRLAMRYGTPSISDVLKDLKTQGCSDIFVLPLYPQYASSTTGSVFEEVMMSLAKGDEIPSIQLLPPYYAESFFIDAFAKQMRETPAVDHWLMSFHGLPESHLRKPTAPCLLSKNCCDQISAKNYLCYRAQCFETARLLAKAMNLAPSTWTVSFQSRLGRAQWIGPSTDEQIEALAKNGIQRLGVVCPSFPIDGLETLEEIGVRGKEIFLAAGGKSFHLSACPNDESSWAQGICTYLQARGLT